MIFTMNIGRGEGIEIYKMVQNKLFVGILDEVMEKGLCKKCERLVRNMDKKYERDIKKFLRSNGLK